MNQSIRIIGGQFRGKKLPFPAIEGLRPTPDRVRETLFNWLMHDIRGARCLDAFAGSGALGFEALSRGAAKVILLEEDKTAYVNLLKSASSFKSEHTDIPLVLKTDAYQFLQESEEQFDIIFLDPPFTKDLLRPCIASLANSTLLVAEGLLYLESPEIIHLDSSDWQPLKVKQAGQVVYGLYKRKK